MVAATGDSQRGARYRRLDSHRSAAMMEATAPAPDAGSKDIVDRTESANATLVAKASDLSTNATIITFNQLGQVVANADSSATLSRVTFSSTGATTSLQVRIGAGGNAKVCDPSLPSTNVRAC